MPRIASRESCRHLALQCTVMHVWLSSDGKAVRHEKMRAAGATPQTSMYGLAAETGLVVAPVVDEEHLRVIRV